MIGLSWRPAETSARQGCIFLFFTLYLVQLNSTLYCKRLKFHSEVSEEISLQGFLCARSTVCFKNILGFFREIMQAKCRIQNYYCVKRKSSLMGNI